MTRGERRHQAARTKAKARRKLMQWKLHDITPKRIGRHAAMHGTCPCWMCTEPFAPPRPKDVFQEKLHDA